MAAQPEQEPRFRPTPVAPVSSQSLFVRNATGLVRDLTPWDAFNLVFSAVLVPIGFMEVMSFAPQFWPHANLLLSFLIAAPLVACFGGVYLYFTELMPRSGGDYVWVSRTLAPVPRVRGQRRPDVRVPHLGGPELRADQHRADAFARLRRGGPRRLAGGPGTHRGGTHLDGADRGVRTAHDPRRALHGAIHERHASSWSGWA